MTQVETSSGKQSLYIDITRLLLRGLRGRRPTGVDRVGLAYIAQFASGAAAMLRIGGRMMALTPAASQRLFAVLLANPNAPMALLRVLFATVGGLRGPACLKGAMLLNTGHSGLERADYGHALRQLELKPVFVLHDLIPITHPEYCRAGEASRHTRRIETMLSYGAGIIANSQATLYELQRFAQRKKLAMPLTVAAPLAPAELPQPGALSPKNQPYFVVLGTIEGRKNLVMLLQLWRTLCERLGAEVPHLVIIGQRGWECENVLDLLERCEALQGSVTELGNCSDSELSTWLGHARALLFPSFAEGYGLPLVEALALGVPVIASDLPAFREIAGAVPDYLDPIDGLGWMELVRDYAAPDSPRRAAQCDRVAAFRAPVWNDHFRRVAALMQELA